jgi:hypothetical protein
MCCFSGAVEHVGATKIFARPTRLGQFLVYSMSVELGAPLAMILPLPVPVSSSDDAVRFVDLSGYPTLFDDLHAAFPMSFAMGQAASRGAVAKDEALMLEVHQVGSFEASFVPSLADFDRLDPRFRISPAVWAKLPQYADWGFAVFQLSPKRGLQTVHPMALELPVRDPSTLFFPTVHIHDGTVHSTARFDHDLYCQVDGILAATLDWNPSFGPLGANVDELRSRGIVRGTSRGFMTSLGGELPNRDVILRPPEVWHGGDVVSATGPCWAVRVHGRYAHADPVRVSDDRRAWCETSNRHLDRVFAALRDGVPALVERYRERWGLAEYPGDMPSFWPARYPNVQRPGAFLFNGECYTKRVEHQEAAFCFAQRPSHDTEREIEGEMRKLLDRALD